MDLVWTPFVHSAFKWICLHFPSSNARVSACLTQSCWILFYSSQLSAVLSCSNNVSFTFQQCKRFCMLDSIVLDFVFFSHKSYFQLFSLDQTMCLSLSSNARDSACLTQSPRTVAASFPCSSTTTS